MPQQFTRSYSPLLLLVAALAGCDFLFPSDPNKGLNNGSPCADSSSGGQSNCDPTQTCLAISKKNMCSLLNCTSDDECGTFHGVQNRCVPVAANTLGCVRGCSLDAADGGTTSDGGGDADGGVETDGGTADAGTTGPCGRDDFICVQATSTDHPICLPDCRQQDAEFCPYGSICSAASGQCEKKVCNGGGCPLGSVCASVDTTPLCVPDCRTKPSVCTAGRTCNGSGGCDVTVRKLYETCGDTIGICGSNLACVQLTDSWTAACYLTCTVNADCASLGGRSTCSISLDDGRKTCLTECYQQTPSCPSATSCVQVPDLSNTYCVAGVE